MSDVKILMVEDEEYVRESFVKLLKCRGYNNILEASKGKDAIGIIEQQKPDIIFLDIQLADDIDGLEVLKQSKIISPETKVIMMSAYRTEYEQRAQKLGADDFLKKPVLKIELLTHAIEEIRRNKGLGGKQT